MLDNQFLEEFLHDEYENVKQKMNNEGFAKLNQEDKLIILIKLNTNHVAHLEEDLNSGLNEVRKETQEVRKDLKEEIQELRKELKEEIQELRKELKEEIQEVRKELKEEIQELREIIESMNNKFDEKFEKNSKEVNEKIYDIHKTLASQTWKIILAMGFMLSFFQFSDKFL